MLVLECDDLRKTFAGGFEAVRGVTFDIEEGEAFGLLGPNGAGKTTTMRMLGTLLPPSGGRATVAGHDVVREAAAVRRAIGFAMQEAGLARYATGREHLMMMGRLYGLSRTQARARSDELLILFGLEDAADRQVRTYSGGMRRRIDLACGLVHRPRLLFLDEPTTGVDPTSRAALWDELRRLQGEGVSLFLTTHYLEEADRLCDRLAIVDRGVIVVRGTPEELKGEVGADVVTVGLGEGEPERAGYPGSWVTRESTAVSSTSCMTGPMTGNAMRVGTRGISRSARWKSTPDSTTSRISAAPLPVRALRARRAPRSSRPCSAGRRRRASGAPR